jgi:Ni/Fe-hydrogenase b-type cytochrome subunit
MPTPSTPLRQPSLLLLPDTVKDAPASATYEHPYIVRLTHWVSAISITVMILSGLEIFEAFPSFGPKLPEKDLFDVPNWLGLGGWLGGALQWHLTFLWPLILSGVLYIAYQFWTGNYRQVLFTIKDISGVWPMARHYFFFGPKPEQTESYNPLQKLAYTAAILFGALAVLTGIALYKPVQFSTLVWFLGGLSKVRIWHFAAMLGLFSFIPGHLVMVTIHGWNNFYSMLIGWKKEPVHASTLENKALADVEIADIKIEDLLVEDAVTEALISESETTPSAIDETMEENKEEKPEEQTAEEQKEEEDAEPPAHT